MTRESAAALEAEHTGAKSLLRRVVEASLSRYLEFPPVATRLAAAYSLWSGDAAPAAPMLFLFSQSDRIVPAPEVQAFAAAQVLLFLPPHRCPLLRTQQRRLLLARALASLEVRMHALAVRASQQRYGI